MNIINKDLDQYLENKLNEEERRANTILNIIKKKYIETPWVSFLEEESEEILKKTFIKMCVARGEVYVVCQKRKTLYYKWENKKAPKRPVFLFGRS